MERQEFEALIKELYTRTWNQDFLTSKLSMAVPWQSLQVILDMRGVRKQINAT